MGWLGRFRRSGGGRLPPLGRSDGPGMDIDLAAVRAHLTDFATTRRGVEAYIEPGTNVTATTIVLVATDGEWTRRAVRDPRAAYDLAQSIGIPVYDVLRTGYPPRMREWSSRQRRSNEREGGGR